MFDPYLNPRIRPILQQLAQPLVTYHISANEITLAGFCIGMLCIPALATEHYWLGLACILCNRLADGLDGAVARLTAMSDSGGFLDIVLDFIFYASVVFGFALANPVDNAIPACFLVVSFMATGSSFLAFAIMANKHQLKNPRYPHKSLHYMQGLVEGSETILFFIVCCLLPHFFPLFAFIFGILCFMTAAVRIFTGYQTLTKLQMDASSCGKI